MRYTFVILVLVMVVVVGTAAAEPPVSPPSTVPPRPAPVSARQTGPTALTLGDYTYTTNAAGEATPEFPNF